jgi:alpha-ketoglutarate-dependent taurine dioxygenase
MKTFSFSSFPLLRKSLKQTLFPHESMNSWIPALIALSVVARHTDDCARPSSFAVRGKTSLPYQLHDREITHGIHPSPLLLDDTPAAELPLLIQNDVKLSLLPSSDESSINNFPLVISPNKDNSLEFLTAFLKHNRVWVEKQMLTFGAILFRGFDIQTASHVETAIRSFEPNLNNQYRGTSPRNALDGSDYIFSAAEVPSHYPIAQHLEMAFLPAPPRRLFFSALQAPQAIGGETALADFRKVYRDLPKNLRTKLQRKKLLYTRTLHKNGVRFTEDVASMKSWKDVFGTANKTEVERMARSEDMHMRWEGRNNDTFVSEFVSEPFQLHPITKEPVWFNHAQVFSWTSFPAELFFAFKRTREWRFLVRAIGVGLKSLVWYGLFRKKMALDVSFGDGTPISIREMHQIRKAVHQNMVFNRWQKGDIVFIDNFSTSHGRQPTYDKGRKVVVAWSDPLKKANEVVRDEVGSWE